MATTPQITANQENAQRSTGPQTDQGKAAVSQNALKHGLTAPFDILPQEDQDEFDALLQSYRDEFEPTGQHQNFLVNQMTQSRWSLARAQRLEICLMRHMLDPETPPDSPDDRIVAAMLKKSADPIGAFQRYAAAAERSYHKAHREFRINAKDQHKREMVEANDLMESYLALPLDPYPTMPFPPPSNAAPVGNALANYADLQLRST
jgi:hypothetical protein